MNLVIHRETRFLVALLVLAPMLAGGCAKSVNESVAPPSSPPNVLLIVIDTLRADHLGSYGHQHNTSPVIDALASEGALFENAFAPASWSKPSVASLMTGLYPVEHGVLTGNRLDTVDGITTDVLAEEHQTLAEFLRGAGYQTAGFARNAHLRRFMGFGQGFDLYSANLSAAPQVTDLLLSWLDRVPVDRFFAYLHFLDIHWPYDPPPVFAEPFHPPATTLDFNNQDTWRSLERTIRLQGGAPPEEADLKAIRAHYDGEIRMVDAALGQLFAALRTQGWWENTLVVVTADHGEEFGDHGGVGHAFTLYDEVLHVPLIISGPGIEPGRVLQQVELIDVLPTLLDLLGIQAPPGLSGRSLQPALQGRELEAKPAMGFHRPLKGEAKRVLNSLRGERYKFIRTTGATEVSAKPRVELYDLIQDPQEQNDLAADQPDVVGRLSAELNRFLADADSSGNQRVPLDDDTLRELRALGYID